MPDCVTTDVVWLGDLVCVVEGEHVSFMPQSRMPRYGNQACHDVPESDDIYTIKREVINTIKLRFEKFERTW